MKKRLYFCLAIVLCSVVYAEPSVTSVSGIVEHDGTITINGIDFGAKNPAAPRIWDACDDGSTNDLDTYYAGDQWPKNCEGYGGTPGETPYLMDYRTSYHGMSMPHNRITKYISAAATTCNGVSGTLNGWDSTWANNLVSIPDWNENKLYLMYWYRMSPTYSKSTSEMGGPNVKEISANAAGGYLAGPDNYKGWCGVPPETYPGDCYERGIGGSCSTENRIDSPNPMGEWIHMEWLWDLAIGEFHVTNGNRVEGGDQFYYPIDHSSPGIPPDSISLGGFVRWPRESVTGNYRYWAGIYADDTYSRVMLGNNPNWDDCTIREPQIPSAWSGNSVTVTTNLGGLSDNAYIFVFDADNSHNEVGYPISLEQISSECGNDICDVDETCQSCIEDCQAHDADNNPCDNSVSLTELINYIDSWKTGQVTIQDVMEAIIIWKG